MVMKIVNPAWKSGAQKKAEQHAPAVAAWLTANPNNRVVTIADLKAAMPEIDGDLRREVVNQIAAIIGAKIEGMDEAE